MTASARRPDGAYDVAIIGGGSAGIAAALAAAGCGATVLVVERADRLGGNVSQAFVHTICGLFHPSPEHEAVFAHDGLPRAIAGRLKTDGSAADIDWAGSAAFLAIDPHAFARTAAALCAHAPAIDVRLAAEVTGVVLPREPSDLCSITFTHAGGRGETVTAWTVVDTSGDANAATLAGAATDEAAPAELQHPSYIFRIDGVEGGRLAPIECARTTAAVARAAHSSRIEPAAGSVLVRNALATGSVFVTLNQPKPAREPYAPLEPAMRARLEADARRNAEQVFELLVATREPFRRARIGAWPARIGIRETRRIRGLETLGVADVLAARRRDDEVCVSTWPVEIWDRAERMTFRHTAGASSIPIGCLVADHPSRRLAMAGRCASATHEALGAIRVLGTAMAMGEAAGAACALAAFAGRDLASVAAEAVRDAIRCGRTTSLV